MKGRSSKSPQGSKNIIFKTIQILKEMLMTEVLQETLMLIGHKDHLIGHRWAVCFLGYVKGGSYKNNPQSITKPNSEIKSEVDG